MLENIILSERYQIQKNLSKKNGCQTLLARDLNTQELVIMKLLAFNSDFEWDNLKLFEREAEILRTLKHESIPRYLDYFDINSQNFKGFALVQNYIPAKSLEEYLQAGRIFTQEDIKEIAQSILEILIYLHEQNPPVIHRDIKPSNILLGDRSGNSVGKAYLVDFGSVQTVTDKNGTMTVVGTYGYMPPEQFGGRAVAASDLYSLGATLIYLVTGIHPADLPQKDFRIQFEQLTNLPPNFTNWLRRMTEPYLEKRFGSAIIALQALNEPQYNLVSAVQKPFGSKIRITKNIDFMEICIPPHGFLKLIKSTDYAYAIIWVVFLTPVLWSLTWWLTLSLLSFNWIILFKLVFWILLLFIDLLLLLYCLLLPYLIVDSLFIKRRLHLESEQVLLTYELLKFKFKHPTLARKNIKKLVYIPGIFDEDGTQSSGTLEIWGEKQEDKISIDTQSNVETEWLAHELSEWLNIPIKQDT